MGKGIEKEKESRGSRQQMNLHLCSEASRDIKERTSQTATEVQLWAHSSGFSPLKIHFSTFNIGVRSKGQPSDTCVIMTRAKWLHVVAPQM